MNELKKRFIDTTSQSSASSKARKSRFAFFLSLTQNLEKPLQILDIGGREQFWKTVGCTGTEEVSVTLVNMEPVSCTLPNFTSVHGDATNLAYADKSFDIVFSNSTIEHVGDWEAQQKMAREVLRVGKRYYIQTPNKYFPIEPHLLFPMFQFLPRSVQIMLLKTVALGNYTKADSTETAEGIINGIRLLSKTDMKKLFPGAHMYDEKMFGLTKSITAYGGF